MLTIAMRLLCHEKWSGKALEVIDVIIASHDQFRPMGARHNFALYYKGQQRYEARSTAAVLYQSSHGHSSD